MIGSRNAKRGLTWQYSVIGAASLVLVACGSDSEDADTPSDGGDTEFAPDGTVEMMVPAPPGGGSDLMVRSFASYYETLDDADNKVENYEGTLAYEIVLGEREGDANLVLGSTASPSFIWKDSLDVEFDWHSFTQLAVFGLDYQYLVVGADSEFQTYEDVAAAAEERTLTLGEAGSGGMNTVAARQLEQAMGTEFEPVIFESGGEQLTAVLAGDVDVAAMDPGEFVPQLEAGEVRAVLCLCNEGNPAEVLADIPAPSDVGLDVEFVNQFRSFIAAAGIDDAARQYWIDAITGWQESEFFDEYVAATLVSPVLYAGDEADSYIETAETAYNELVASS